MSSVLIIDNEPSQLAARAEVEETPNQEEWQNQDGGAWQEKHPSQTRERDRRSELLGVPGGSADQRARDALEPRHPRRPAI